MLPNDRERCTFLPWHVDALRKSDAHMPTFTARRLINKQWHGSIPFKTIIISFQNLIGICYVLMLT